MSGTAEQEGRFGQDGQAENPRLPHHPIQIAKGSGVRRGPHTFGRRRSATALRANSAIASRRAGRSRMSL